MDPQKETEYLREKAALLERCLEYERLLRDMREATPKEPVDMPYTPWAPQPSGTGEPYRYWDTVTIC